MLFAADLHIHSWHSQGASPAMTFENIAVWALRKGMSILGTGDCLQPAWLSEIQSSIIPAEKGLFALKPEIERRVFARLPPNFRRPLRFVLTTEVACDATGTRPNCGSAYLLFFPSFDLVHAVQRTVSKFGNLSDGLPTLALEPRVLLKQIDAHGDCYMAPSQILNPWFGALGSISGEQKLERTFEEDISKLFAVESGLDATLPMCRRLSTLAPFSLIAGSDARELEAIGRESIVVDSELDFEALFSAMKEKRMVRINKFPVHRARFYLNWCNKCRKVFNAVACPECNETLVTGTRDRLESIADRAIPEGEIEDPPFQELLPLTHVIGDLINYPHRSHVVLRVQQELLEVIGDERHILVEADEKTIAAASTERLANAIVTQRQQPSGYFSKSESVEPPDEALIELGAIYRSPI